MKRRKRIEGEDNSSGASSAARQIPTSPCFRSEKDAADTKLVKNLAKCRRFSKGSFWNLPCCRVGT